MTEQIGNGAAGVKRLFGGADHAVRAPNGLLGRPGWRFGSGRKVRQPDPHRCFRRPLLAQRRNRLRDLAGEIGDAALAPFPGAATLGRNVGGLAMRRHGREEKIAVRQAQAARKTD
jgi:hypothetical protein